MVNIEKPRKGFSFFLSMVFTRLLSHKPKIVDFSDGFPNGPYIIISNHEGMKTPTKMVEYINHDFVFWAHHSITSSFKELHDYLSKTYLHNKKHLPKWLSWLVASFIAPFIYRYYRSVRLIPVYRDLRSLSAIKTSTEALRDGQALVIFPEDSDTGYKTKIEIFNNGYITLLEHLEKKEMRIPLFICYLDKKHNTFYIDKPIFYKDLKDKYSSPDSISNYLREKMNCLSEKR